MAMIIVGGGQFKGSSGGDGDGGGQDSNDEDLRDDDEQVEWNTASRGSGKNNDCISVYSPLGRNGRVAVLGKEEGR
jgi:hypothetical protein